MSTGNVFLVRQATELDVAAIALLEKRIFGPLETGYYGEEHIQTWLNTFPSGLLVAESDQGVIAYIYGQLIDFDPADIEKIKFFNEATQGGLTAETHTPSGNALHGIILCSLARGAGSALYQAHYALVKKLGLKYYVGHSRMPGFAAYYEALLVDSDVDVQPFDEAEIALWYVLNTAERVGAKKWPGLNVNPSINLPEPSEPDYVLRKHLRLPGSGVLAVVSNGMKDPQSRNFCVILALELEPDD